MHEARLAEIRNQLKMNSIGMRDLAEMNHRLLEEEQTLLAKQEEFAAEEAAMRDVLTFLSDREEQAKRDGFVDSLSEADIVLDK